MSFPRDPHRLLLALSLIVVTTACSRSQDSTGAQRAPIPVTVATVTQKPVPVQLRAIGNVVPTETATVRSRVGGILTAVEFKEGQDVKQGQLLFTIDRRPLEEQLRQAQANLAKSTTQLENAQKQASRYAELVEQGFVAQEQYDQLRTTALAAQATANADRAAVENARLQLEWASIRAPISGRTGALAVHEGDLVVPNTTALVVIDELQPVDVAFALPSVRSPTCSGIATRVRSRSTWRMRAGGRSRAASSRSSTIASIRRRARSS